MRKRTDRLISSCVFSTLLVSSALLPNFAFAQKESKESSPSLNRYIIVMEEAPVFQTLSKESLAEISAKALQEVKANKDHLKQTHGKLLKTMSEKGVKFKKTHDYSIVLNGISVEIPKNQADEIRSLPGVKSVYPDQTVHGNVSESVPLIGAPDVWSKQDSEGTNVTGKGVTVAVIDSGVNYTHPDLGGAFGPEHKVVAGYDYVNDDADPMDDNGHGTHVAGIIAANGKLKGVAPDASITAYKVLKDNSGAMSDVIAAIEASIQPDNPYRADVINLSLSNTSIEDPQNPNNPLSIAAQNAVEAGVVVVASAGNQGKYGKIGAPANAKGVLAVGASISGYKVPDAKMVAPFELELKPLRLGFSANPPEADTTRDLVNAGEGKPEDYEGLDVKGKVVLVKPNYDTAGGEPDLTIPANIAQEKGAYAILFVHNSPTTVDPGPLHNLGEAAPSQFKSSKYKQPEIQQQSLTSNSSDARLEKLIAMEISAELSEVLKSQLTHGPVKINVTGEDQTDKMWNDSSHGDLVSMKPDIVAPGYMINSTYTFITREPKGFYNGYNRLDGTSMAAPHVAGAAALLKQLNPSWQAGEISAALKETAKPLDSYDLNIQGAGRIDVNEAAKAKVIVSPNALTFGLADTKTAIEEIAVTSLKNHGEKPVDIDFTVKELKKSGASISVSPSSVHIEPGQNANIKVKIIMDQVNSDTDISGWIEGNIQSTDEVSNVRVPFKLPVRHLQITVSPDPASSDTEAFIYSPVDLEQAPQVTIRTPDGKSNQVTAVLDHRLWWRAPIQKDMPGIYQIEATATLNSSSTEVNKILKGSAAMEILPVENDPNTDSWEPIGPNASAAWLHVDQKNQKEMAAVPLHLSSIFHTQNAANAWQEMHTFPLAAGFPVEMVVDPTNEKRIYVPINSDEDPTYTGKIVASEDGGKSWRTLPFPNVPLSGLEIDESGNKLIAISNNEVYVSQDRGNSWELLPGWWNALFEARLVNGDLYLTNSEGVDVFRNVFSGSAQSELVFKPPFPYGGISDVVGNKDILIANVMGGGMYASYNNGKDWVELKHSGKSFYEVSHLEILDGKIYAGTFKDGILVSEDYGKKWKSWKEPLPGNASNEVDFALGSNNTTDKPSFYVSSLQAGIYETKNNGITYNRIGIPAATVYDLAISRDSKTYQLIAGTESNTYRKVLQIGETVDATTREWGPAEGEGRTGEQVQHLQTSPADSKIVYKIRMDHNFFSHLYRSNNGGESWEQKLDWMLPALALHVHPADPNQITVPYYDPENNLKGIYISKDGGESWNQIEQQHVFLTLAGDPRDPNKIWAGGNDGIFFSEDMGETFQKVHNIPVSNIVISPNNPEHLVFGGQQLYMSTDGGKTLQESIYNKELGIYVNDIQFSPKNANVVYAAAGAFYESGLLKGGRGVLRSIDGGKKWENISQGLDNRNATALEISPDGTYLYVGTEGGSVHRINLKKK